MSDNLGYTEGGTATKVATDERTISGTTVHIQRISEIGASAFSSGQTTVSNAGTAIAAAADTRKRIVLVNQETVPVWIGAGTAVATTTGLRLDPGASVTLYTTGAVYGITESAYTASGDAKVQYIEETD